MGLFLTKEEEKRTAPIVKPCFAALGLANDYYSFDIEWKEFQEEKSAGGNPTMTNAVWLYMQWENLSVDDAKERVRQVVRKYESEYQKRVDAFRADGEQCSPKLSLYLKALAYQIPGNIVWSLRCPRYHPELCAEAEGLLRDYVDVNTSERTKLARRDSFEDFQPLTQADSDSESSGPSSIGSPQSHPSSRSSVGSLDLNDELEDQKPVHLGTEVRSLNFPISFFQFPC
jgi:hypothetical protein